MGLGNEERMSDDTKVTVERTIDASADAVFDILSNPHRHPALDGSGFIRSVDHADRIQKVGDVFTMNMVGDHMGGEYKTDNHVTGYVKDKLLAWQTARRHRASRLGMVVGDRGSGPRHDACSSYLRLVEGHRQGAAEKVKFPLVTEDQLSDTLSRLAAETSS